MYAYERITDPAGFAAIEGEWHALAKASGGGVFASHAFLLSWAETYGRGRPLVVSLLRHKGKLVGAMPMFRTGQARAVAAMGEGRAGMAQWLLHPDLPDAEAALAALLRPDWLSFWRLEPLETPDAEMLERAARLAGLAVRRKATMSACSVTANGDFDSYLGGLKSKTRQVFRRSERKLAEMEVRDLRSDRDGRAALDAYLAASRASWKGLTGTGYGAAPEGVAFLEKLFARLGPEACFFAARQVDDVAISGRFVLVHDNVHYGMANDFNEEYAELAVGRNSVMQSVRDAFEGGAAGFDFTRCNGLVREVSTDERPLERLLIHRPGDPTLAAFFAARGVRRLRRRASGWQKGPARGGVVKVVLSRDLTPGQHAAVRTFCDASPGYSYLQDPDWPGLMQDEGGRHSYRHVLVERDAGGLAAYGVLRLSRVPGGLALGAFRRGPVVAAPADLEPVLTALLPALRNAGLITVAMNPRWEDAEAETVERLLARLGGQVAPPARQRLHSCTGLIDLAPTPEEIFAACTAHARRNLRKLDKLDLTLRPVADGAEMARVRDWTQAFARARGLTTRGLPGLEAQRDWIARHGGALILVEAEGAPVGAFSLLRDGPRVLNMSNGWADPDARLPRSYLVYWYAIRRWAGGAEPGGPRWLDLAGRDDPRVPRADAGAEGRERFKDGFPQRHAVLPRMHRFVLRPLLARVLDGVEYLRG